MKGRRKLCTEVDVYPKAELSQSDGYLTEQISLPKNFGRFKSFFTWIAPLCGNFSRSAFFCCLFLIFKAPISAKSVPIENFSDFLRYFYRVKVLDKTHIWESIKERWKKWTREAVAARALTGEIGFWQKGKTATFGRTVFLVQNHRSLGAVPFPKRQHADREVQRNEKNHQNDRSDGRGNK